MTKRNDDGSLAWRIEATERARAELHKSDLQDEVWRHLAYVSATLARTRAGRAGNLQRTVGRDRHGREFWTVSSLRDGLTLVFLPDEL